MPNDRPTNRRKRSESEGEDQDDDMAMYVSSVSLSVASLNLRTATVPTPHRTPTRYNAFPHGVRNRCDGATPSLPCKLVFLALLLDRPHLLPNMPPACLATQAARASVTQLQPQVASAAEVQLQMFRSDSGGLCALQAFRQQSNPGSVVLDTVRADIGLAGGGARTSMRGLDGTRGRCRGARPRLGSSQPTPRSHRGGDRGERGWVCRAR